MIGDRFKTTIDFSNPIHLFEVVLNNLIYKKRENDYLTHSQIAYLVFNSGDSIQQSYMSLVTNNFGDYLIHFKGKYKFDLIRIKQDFPSFFDINNNTKNIIEEIQLAVRQEKLASFRKRAGRIVYILSSEVLAENEQYYFYTLYLNLENEEMLKIYEGMQIKLALDKKRFMVTALDYADSESKLTIRFEQDIKSVLSKSKKARIVIDASWLLDKLHDNLDNFPPKKLPVSKLLSPGWEPQIIDNSAGFYEGVLKNDESQIDTIEKCLNHDITAIWGPPGTGKTTTLGYLLLELFRRKEKTLVCSIANVAVDSVLKTTLSVFGDFEINVKPINYRGGKVIRAGYSSDEEVNDNPDVKLESNHVRILNHRLRKIKQQLLKNELDDELVAILRSDRVDLIKEIEKEKKRIIWGANLIFATASKIEIDEALQNLQVDNIIVDEASMMSAPHLLAVAKNSNKRIIIAGDFRQLGPIAIAQSELAYKWLRTDLFEFFGVNHKNDAFDHPSLSMIVNQRRFHVTISDLINQPFYQHKLKTKTDHSKLKLYRQKPEVDKTILYYDISNIREYKVERTKEQSRYNMGSINFTIEKILKPLRKHTLRTPFTITIITPYKAQVRQYNNILNGKIKDPIFLSRIKIGTVHSFQGSQADLIIFDLVDSFDEKIGRLYWQNTGERLINVAISRATGKLIFVGDINAIIEGNGYNNVSYKVNTVLRKIADHSVLT